MSVGICPSSSCLRGRPPPRACYSRPSSPMLCNALPQIPHPRPGRGQSLRQANRAVRSSATQKATVRPWIGPSVPLCHRPRGLSFRGLSLAFIYEIRPLIISHRPSVNPSRFGLFKNLHGYKTVLPAFLSSLLLLSPSFPSTRFVLRTS